MSRFVFDILEENRAYYNSLNQQQFMQKVEISDEVISNFIRYGKSLQPPIYISVDHYKPLLKKYLKAVMVQQLFGTNAFERILNTDDRLIEKVIDLSLQN